MADARLLEEWRECQRHIHHMDHALAALEAVLPLDGDQLAVLDDEAVQDLDQFVLRFDKLQDAIGLRLFPALLSHLGEPYEDWPMRDRLDRLEKLGYVADAGQWQKGVKMSIVDHIYEEVQRLPEPLAQEVFDFIGYLEAKHGLREQSAEELKEAQEPVMNRLWENPEDEVWDEW